MSADHTPGPWEVSENVHNNSEMLGPYKEMGASIRQADGCVTWYICRMEGCLPNEQATARLIAAAPELLEALEFILENAEFKMSDAALEKFNRGEFNINTLRAKAEAAIAKAKGGSE